METHTQREGNEKMAINKPSGEAQNRSSLTALRRNQLCQHLDLRLPASKSVRKSISVV